MFGNFSFGPKVAKLKNFGKVDASRLPFRCGEGYQRFRFFSLTLNYVRNFDVFSLKSSSKMGPKARVSRFCRFQGSLPGFSFDTSGETLRTKLRSFTVQSAVTLPKIWPPPP